MKDRALVEIALREGAVPQDKLAGALSAQREMEKFKISKPLSSLLVEKGIVPKDRVASLLEVVATCSVRCPGCGRTTGMDEADRNGVLKCKGCSEVVDYPDGRIAEDNLAPGARSAPAKKREAKAAAAGPRREPAAGASGGNGAAPASPRPRAAGVVEEAGSPREITRFELGPMLGVSPCGKSYSIKQGKEIHCLKVLDRAVCADKGQFHRWVELVKKLQDLPKNVTPHGGQLHKEGSTNYTVRTFLGDEESTLAARATALKASPNFATVVAMSDKLLESLVAFHATHQAHGNLKPQNIVFTQDAAVLIDPGLHFLLAGLPREERAARLRDCSRYLAPEVLSGSEPTAAADVYAAGRCIEDLLIAAGCAEKSGPLNRTVARMVSPDPSERLPTAKDVLRELHSGKGAPQAPSRTLPRARKLLSRGAGAHWLHRLPLERIGAVALCVVGAFLGFQTYLWFGARSALAAPTRASELERQVIGEHLDRLQADTLASPRPQELEPAWREMEDLLAGSSWEETVRQSHDGARKAAPGGREAQDAASLEAARAAIAAGDARGTIRRLLGLRESAMQTAEVHELLQRATKKLQDEEGIVVIPADPATGGKAFLLEASLARSGSVSGNKESAPPSSSSILVNISCGDAGRIAASRSRRMLKASEWDRAQSLASGHGPSWARAGGELLKAGLEGSHFEWVEPEAADVLLKEGFGLCKGGDRAGVPRAHGIRRKRDQGYPDVGVRFAEDL